MHQPLSSRNALVLVSALAAMAVTPSAPGANIALVAENPLVQRIGYVNGGTAPVPAAINDGNPGTAAWSMTDSFRSQMGYSFNALANVDTVVINQFSQGGIRKRLSAVDIYTSNNHYTFTNLPDTDILTLNLDGSAISGFTIVPISKQASGSDHNLGIAEIEAHTALPLTARTNWAAGITPTSTGGYNSGAMAGLTDGDLYTNTIYKVPGGSAIFDLGETRSIGGFGIGWNILNGSNRQVFASALLEFSNLPDFSVLEGSENLNFVGLLAFQQLDFAAVEARYVRVTDAGRLQPSGTETDANTGLIEMQFLSPIMVPIPEPASLALLACGGCIVFRRRRS